MLDFKSVILPAAVGVLGGLLGPILVEKWKDSEAESKMQLIMEEKLQSLEEKATNLSASLDSRVPSLESEIKAVEIDVSRNAGILKGSLPDIPLEVQPSKSQS